MSWPCCCRACLSARSCEERPLCKKREPVNLALLCTLRCRLPCPSPRPLRAPLAPSQSPQLPPKTILPLFSTAQQGSQPSARSSGCPPSPKSTPPWSRSGGSMPHQHHQRQKHLGHSPRSLCTRPTRQGKNCPGPGGPTSCSRNHSQHSSGLGGSSSTTTTTPTNQCSSREPVLLLAT